MLHDAHMDIRAPTHELTRAHAVLRARRQILARPPDWALGREGVRRLTGRGEAGPVEMSRKAEGGVTAQLDLGEPIEADGPDPQAGRYPGGCQPWPAGARRRAVVGVASEWLHQERRSSADQ